MRRFLTTLACLLGLAVPASAAPPLSQLCAPSHQPMACGGELGTGWFFDNTYSAPTYDAHYLVGGVDWLELSGSSTTLTMSSEQATTLDIQIALTFDAATFSDAITLSDGAVIDQAANNSLDFTENSETLSLDFSSNLVDIDASGTGAAVSVTSSSTIQLLNGGATAGWSAPTGANTACATTCAGAGACLFGIDNAGPTLVACADATADSCICGGPSS